MDKYTIITGSSGAIGSALVEKFSNAGYKVCAVDIFTKKNKYIDLAIDIDLKSIAYNKEIRDSFFNEIKKWLNNNFLDIIINNAAYQYVSEKHPIDPSELMNSYAINVVAPYLLATHLKDNIREETGQIINIGSIHSRLTKPGFLAYSTTKSALAGLTRALALDFGSKIRVNCIEPAAIETPMLHAGFAEHPEKFEELKAYHPQTRIGTPEEVAELALLISSPKIRFLHGACIDISGGITARLHDPV